MGNGTRLLMGTQHSCGAMAYSAKHARLLKWKTGRSFIESRVVPSIIVPAQIGLTKVSHRLGRS